MLLNLALKGIRLLLQVVNLVSEPKYGEEVPFLGQLLLFLNSVSQVVNKRLQV